MNLLNGVVIFILLASIPTDSVDIRPSSSECVDRSRYCPARIGDCWATLWSKLCPDTCGNCCDENFDREENKEPNTYRHVIVLKKKDWESARQYCKRCFNGDLIQHDPRLYTRKGRQQIAQSLNLPFGGYHIGGIIRDSWNPELYKRISDGAEVRMEGWWQGDGEPFGDHSNYKHLYWDYGDNEYKNLIWKYISSDFKFICEY